MQNGKQSTLAILHLNMLAFSFSYQAFIVNVYTMASK